MQARAQAAAAALKDMLAALRSDVDIAVFDAQVTRLHPDHTFCLFTAHPFLRSTNSTRERRRWLRERITAENESHRVLFLESVCDNAAVVEANIREVKLTSPDYEDAQTEQAAVEDFKKRIAHYERAYEMVGPDEG